MWRRWAWVGIALFVVADVVLIALALDHTRADPDPAGQASIVTSSPGDVSPSMTSSSSTASSSAHPTATSPTEPAPDATGPAGAGGTSTAPATTASGPPADADPSVSVLLDMANDGTAIRAVRGGCTPDASTPTTVEMSDDSGATWKSAAVRTSAVERVAAGRDGKSWFVATDESCDLVEHDASAGGEGWTTSSPDGAWSLTVDASAAKIMAPTGVVDIDCVPRSLASIDSHGAVVACTDGSIEATTDGGSSWTDGQAIPGVVSISFVGEKTGYALAADGGCAARVLTTTDGAKSWSKLACLAGSRAQAITAAGDTVLAQVDGTIQRSDDKGDTWS